MPSWGTGLSHAMPSTGRQWREALSTGRDDVGWIQVAAAHNRGMKGRELVNAILQQEDGILTMSSWRSLRSTVWRLVHEGVLVRVFPGTYVPAGTEDQRDVYLRALSAWKPDGVVSGELAHKLHAGTAPQRASELGRVTVDRPGRSRPRGRVKFRRRTHESVIREGGIRIATPTMVAVDRAGWDGGRAIDDLLRTRHVDPSQLAAVMPHFRRTRHNPSRRRVVAESMTSPYSYAERTLHRLLKKAGIVGWVANPVLRLGGELIRPDVLLRDARLVIEVDGREFHSGAVAFEHDRARQNQLVTHKYRVLRFTMDMLENDPAGVIRTIRAGLRDNC